MTTVYTTNDMNEYSQVGGAAYTYDENGNMISAADVGGTTTYAYDQDNQLVGVTAPGEDYYTYEYNFIGYQVSSVQNGEQINNLIDPSGLGNVVGQFDVSNNVIDNYTYGIGLVSQVNVTGNAAYYEFDQTGNTVGINNAAGQYVNRYNYFPFGQGTTLTAALPNPFTFAGKYGVSTDRNGLVDMRNRSYDPTTGQFVENDPLGLSGGDINIRRLSQNDPIEYTDPSGLDFGFPTNLDPVFVPLINIIRPYIKGYNIGVSGGAGSGEQAASSLPRVGKCMGTMAWEPRPLESPEPSWQRHLSRKLAGQHSIVSLQEPDCQAWLVEPFPPTP